MRALRRVVPLCALFWAIWVLEGSGQTRAISEEGVTPARTRLAILLVDSLAREDVETPGLMPMFRALREREAGLEGPVAACADAITVPCFSAMNTGRDAQSVFAVGKNFTPDAGSAREGVIGRLRRLGLRVGYVGDDIIGTAVQGLEVVEIHKHDEEIVARGLRALERGLDVIVIHTHETDETAHKKGGRSAEYRAVLKRVDENIVRIKSALRPEDHFAVLGDHGHSPDGRHFAGLEVPTYATYFGPKFARKLTRPMTVTDQGAIWGEVFELRAKGSWVGDYFTGKPVPIPNSLEAPRGADPVARSTALVVALIALSVFVFGLDGSALLHVKSRAFAAVSTALVAAGLGVYWIEITNVIWAQPMYVRWLVALACAALGGFCLWPVLHKTRSFDLRECYALGFAGVTVFALPTVYKHGGMFTVYSWLGLGFLLVSVFALAQKRWLDAASALALWFPLWTLYNPNVNNFALRYFPAYREFLRPFIAPVCIGLLLWAVWPAPGDERAIGGRHKARFIAVVIGIASAALSRYVPVHVFIIPCVLALPLALWALRAPNSIEWAICAAIAAAWFFAKEDLVTLGPTLAVLVLWAYVPARALSQSRLAASTSLFVLSWLSLWASMGGARIAGLDFDFFFRWLPEDQAVTDLWLPQALLTTAKYLILPTLGLCLALAREPKLKPLLRDAAHLGAARAAFVIVVLTARAQASGHAAPFIIADIAQEATTAAILTSFLSGCSAFLMSNKASTSESISAPAAQRVTA